MRGLIVHDSSSNDLLLHAPQRSDHVQGYEGVHVPHRDLHKPVHEPLHKVPQPRSTTLVLEEYAQARKSKSLVQEISKIIKTLHTIYHI